MRPTSQRRIDPRCRAWTRRDGFLSFYYRSRVRADSQKGRIDSVGLDELFWARDSVGSRLSLFRKLPDGGRSPATKLELAVAYAINIARALKWQRIHCETLNGNHGVPWGLENVLKELPSLHGGLIDLGGVLSDTSVRQQLASANTDAVEFAGEFAPSYAEAVFTAGERLLVTISMLCLHGVEYNFLSRLHPASKPEDLGEPWKSVPVPTDVVFKPNDAGCLRSQEMLVSRIVNFILDLPEVNDDHVRILLEKEIGRVAMGEPSPDATKQKAKRSTVKGEAREKIAIQEGFGSKRIDHSEKQEPTIKEIEDSTPALDENSTEWIRANNQRMKKEASIESLRTMRSDKLASRNETGTFGIDKAGRKWRKERGSSKTVYYYRPSLKSDLSTTPPSDGSEKS